MKKNSIIVIICIILLLITGCSSSKKKKSTNRIDTTKEEMIHEHCTRGGNAGSGVEVSLNYDLYHTGEILNILVSEEKVTSENQSSLDKYEEAYKQIHENYKGLDYYDAKVERTDTTVTSTININYDKIDIKKLLDIEGEEDNIIENNKAKVTKWIELAEKFGTKCEEVKE